MLHSMKDLQNCEIKASGRRVAHVTGLHFDDHQRAVRYLLAGTSSWLSGHKALMPPIVIYEANCVAKALPVSTTRAPSQEGAAHRRDRALGYASKDRHGTDYRYHH